MVQTGNSFRQRSHLARVNFERSFSFPRKPLLSPPRLLPEPEPEPEPPEPDLPPPPEPPFPPMPRPGEPIPRQGHQGGVHYPLAAP